VLKDLDIPAHDHVAALDQLSVNTIRTLVSDVEVGLAVDAHERLIAEGVRARARPAPHTDNPKEPLMQLGMIGLGRMGANLVRRLMRDGHECVVYDLNPASVRELEREGATGADTLADFVAKLDFPRVAWVMVPAAFTGETIDELAALMHAGDIVIDGGNSYYRDDVDRAKALAPRGIHYVDVGTSGGVFGLERGFCLMIGGEPQVVEHLDPLFRTIAPGVDAAARTPGRDGAPTAAERGYLHCGPAGAGHFVKMVHNGIEYGMMAAFAEGLNLLHKANAGAEDREDDAETAPLRDPEYYRYDIDTAAVAEVWRRGSVVASWLLDLTAAALADSPELEGFAGHVSDSGEGRWTVLAAVDVGAPAHVLTASLYDRFASRGKAQYADKLLSAMRAQFGGHAEKVAA
jgi:6-phosphogluconate dehydrogenase